MAENYWNDETQSLNYQLVIRRIWLIIVDFFCIELAVNSALLIRLSITGDLKDSILTFHPVMKMYALPVLLISYMSLAFFHAYSSLWAYAGYDEIVKIAEAALVQDLLILLMVEGTGSHFPWSVYIVEPVFLTVIVVASRMAYRIIRIKRQNMRLGVHERKNVMIVGAGEAGRSLISEIVTSQFINKKVCCVIDDDPTKWGRYILNHPIVGGRNKIVEAAEGFHIDEIIVALPKLSNRELRPILEICKQTECELKRVPGVYQLVNGEVEVNKLRNVSIEDLLGRDEIKVNLDDITGYLTGKTVMVTGGGGSIGSELCRQIAAANPEKLIIFDIYENNAYEIQQELLRKYPELNLETLIGSVRDEGRLNRVFETHRPNIVFHAAAHKHVPLMEDSPNEAIKNNVLGTYKTAKMAHKWGAERFVLISTDKAVNPTNIMGATKRICEMIVQTYGRKSETEFVAVRFGNVLGSNGSVIPLFRKQIESGGPITVTHPDIIRYFMTIPEAVSLVLQAGAYAKGGEIFVLDMGDPVKIDDLAKNMIRLSGLTLGKDIEIKYTGLRPGEKLYEELLMAEEGMGETPNKLIHIGKPIDVNEEELNEALYYLEKEAYAETSEMKALVAKVVPTYHPATVA